MSDEFNTRTLHALIDRFRQGDGKALDDLISRAATRLERIARKMLGKYPGVRAKEETGDVFQNAVIRLTRSLHEVKPASVREFYGLAAVHIRRELLDLARKYKRRAAEELNGDPTDHATTESELARWTALHEAVEALPIDLREVFSLKFYHGWTQAETAELLQISDRTVRRMFVDAMKQLERLAGDLPAA